MRNGNADMLRQLTMGGLGPVHWRVNWATVRASTCDRERLRWALKWAVFTVHSSVAEAERSFRFYATTGALRTRCLENRRTRALAEVDAFCDTLRWRTFRRASVAAKLDSIVAGVYGIGYAKATFALTFAGVIDVACLDVHAIRRALGRERVQWRNARAYLVDVRRAFGIVRGSGRRQWAAYEQWVPAFARSQHAGVFEIIINGGNNRASQASVIMVH